MSRLRAQGEFEVSLGPCQCKDSPHDEDTAWLPESLAPDDALEAMALVLGDDPEEVTQRKVAKVFLRHARWNLLDDDGEPEPFDTERFDWPTISPIANAASNKYTEELTAPFRAALQQSLQHGPTGDSTSPNKPSTPESP